MKHSAGIIPFRDNEEGILEFFVGHPGGWDKRDYWGFLKGGIEEGEDIVDAAIREFKEESGLNMIDCDSFLLIPLGNVRQNPNKTVEAFGLYYPYILPSECHSNLTEDGVTPEIDKYRWMTYEELKDKTHPTHLRFYKLLTNMWDYANNKG